MTNADPLPACPFCGSADVRTEERMYGAGGAFRAVIWTETECQDCGANTTGDTAEQSEAKWRKRTP